VIHSEFVLSAASISDFPQTGLPEIAMVGRSNVGKSTLINALVQKIVARTSAAPGKTRLANYYLIQPPAFYLVDLPGYGYARGGRESAETFEALTSAYFAVQPGSPRRIAGVCHLIDARHPHLPQDISAHRWVKKTNLPIAVIATKMDKLKRADRTRTVRALENTYAQLVLPESALEHEGFDAIWKTIRGWLGRA
jgi:GTP-binding protein